ncbi:MAG TPA: hypothetical protein VE860_22890 [Chthoniobacterales bacterium]|jgi:hypothetical protein|nr:hypothetical protein [Chthoniobacterales bacterium]
MKQFKPLVARHPLDNLRGLSFSENHAKPEFAGEWMASIIKQPMDGGADFRAEPGAGLS